MVSRDGDGMGLSKAIQGIELIIKSKNFITTEIQIRLLFFGRLIRLPQ